MRKVCLAHRMRYRLSDFDYALPPELIAQVPAATRSASRLLHVDGMRRADLAFTDLPALLAPRRSRRVQRHARHQRARVRRRRRPAAGSSCCSSASSATHEAWAQVRASHPPRVGAVLALPGGATRTRARARRSLLPPATSTAPARCTTGSSATARCRCRRTSDAARGPGDRERYQTIYAREPGAVAAPTAGLHFDDAMLAALAARGVRAAPS